MSADFLLYGSNGYTGRLIVRRALEQGLRPRLAGRNADEVGAQAAEHGLEHRVVSLDETAKLEAAMEGVPAVLHAAGPFAHTAAPVAEACIRTGTHYVDITGEMGVFEALAARGPRAAEAGVMLLPGAGFDVVPTDAVAAHLARRLPSAARLSLAFRMLGGGVSRGTATTMVENAGRGGAVRRGGRIVPVPNAWRTRTIDFGFGTRPALAVTIPWGDVATAYHSTGIPDIQVYTRVTPGQRRMMIAGRYLGPLLSTAPVQRLLRSRVRSRAPGPSDEARARGAALVWGEARDGEGRTAVTRMRTPEGYTLTAMTSVEVVRRILAGDAPPGFRTPSLAYGPDWILDFDGVERVDE